MSTSTYKMVLPGAMIQRGFWLYVCKITTNTGKEYLYVGRTGDSSSPNAAAPFARLGQHLEIDGKANAILRHLKKAKVGPDKCAGIDMIACGPLLCEVKDKKNKKEHYRRRDIIAALVKKLAEALKQANYDVLNEVHSNAGLDVELWIKVQKSFAEHFPKLRQ